MGQDGVSKGVEVVAALQERDEAPAGVPLERCPKVRLVLSLLHREEDLEALRWYGAGAQRRQQILRLATQAQEQRGLLTQEDLAWLLSCNVRTIRSDIKRLREQDITVPTLVIGAQHDTMDPEHMEWMAGELPNGRYLFCPDGSHMAMYDDQVRYFDGLVRFIEDVDAGR